MGLGFMLSGRVEGARDQVNLHPESESGVRLTLKFFSNVLAVNDH